MTNTYKATCRRCGKFESFEASPDKLQSWLRKEILVQDAFPDIPASTREMLVSGTCGTCWKDMFGPMEDDEDACSSDLGSQAGSGSQ